MGSSSLTLVQDRMLSSTVTQVTLCPNMHLLAVTLDGNSIAIFRTSWHRLATISVTMSLPDERIQTVTWSPTGSHLVAATSCNRLFIYSVDRVISTAPSNRARRGTRDTESVSNITLPSSATRVVWVPSLISSSSEPRYEDRASMLLPIISPKSSTQDNTHRQKVNENGLIFLGDTDGFLTVLTSDLSFTVARVNILSSATGSILSNYLISNIHVTNNMKRCVIVATPSSNSDEKESKSENEQKQKEPGNVIIRIIDISFLRKFRHEIERFTKEVIAWNDYLKIASTDIEKIEYAWTQSICDILVSSIVKPLRQVMEQYAEDGTKIWEELHDIFCGARMKGSILHFLANNLGENGAKELLRSFEVHDTDANGAFSHLLPLTENTLSRASQLRSIVNISTKFQPIGLHAQHIDSLFHIMTILYQRLFLASENVIQLSNEPAFFLVWICLTARKASGDSDTSSQVDFQLGSRETRNILKFFERMTRRQVVTSLIEEEEDESNEWNVELEQDMKERRKKDENDKMKDVNDETRVEDVYGITLKSYLLKVQDVFQELTKKPCTAISSKLCVVAELSLNQWCGTNCNIYDWDNGKNIVVSTICMDGNKNNIVTILKHKLSGKNKGVWSACKLGLERDTIHDAVIMQKQGTKVGLVTENSEKKGEYSMEMIGVGNLMTLLNDELHELHGQEELNEKDIVLEHIKRSGNRLVLPPNSKQKSAAGFHLNQNEETHVVSMLAMPRRLLVLEDAGYASKSNVT